MLSEKEMLATLVPGSAFESVDSHIYIARSKDGGKTWMLENPLYLGSLNRPTSERGRITRMRLKGNRWLNESEAPIMGSGGASST